MRDWPVVRDQGWLQDVLGSKKAAKYWGKQFEETSKGNIDSWGYRWTFACWREGMISVLPEVNLVKNIGFGEGATHTKGDNKGDASSMTKPLQFPLRYPAHMIVDRRADTYTMKTRFSRPFVRRLFSKVRRVLLGVSR